MLDAREEAYLGYYIGALGCSHRVWPWYKSFHLVETDKFGMTTNGLGRLANKGEAGYIVKVTKSFHSLALTILYTLKHTFSHASF